MKSILIALSFLTILPLKPDIKSTAELKKAQTALS